MVITRLSRFAGALALALSLIAVPTASFAGIFVGLSVNFAPPELPVYVQPPCPTPDYVWTPGYWGNGPYGYYWVPGTWVEAPEVGFLWTPGYWGFANNGYFWHTGYWGQQVGFYGGINYGFGYSGNGYYGGNWSGNHFRYNTAYSNVGPGFRNDTYMNRSVGGTFASTARVSFNGGAHGVQLQANAAQRVAWSQHHISATSAQTENASVAASNRNYLATVNHGRPTNVAFATPLAASHRPTNFTAITRANTTAVTRSHTVTTTHAATYHAPAAATYHAPAAATYHAPAAATYHAPGATTYHVPASATYHVPASGTYHAPAATTYHAPAAATYHAPPATTYHAPAAPEYRAPASASYHAPATTYHAPATAYHAPVTHAATYHAPAGQSHAGGGGHAPGASSKGDHDQH